MPRTRLLAFADWHQRDEDAASATFLSRRKLAPHRHPHFHGHFARASRRAWRVISSWGWPICGVADIR